MMFKIEEKIRKNILDLKPYRSARQEYTGSEGVYLDANENPYGFLNRYPDPLQAELKSALSKIKGISVENIFIGNGSDEIIDLSFRIFCDPGLDKALTISPSYGIYEVAADINAVKLIKVSLRKDFSLNIPELKMALHDPDIKLFILCSPNNPTGKAFGKDQLMDVFENYNGIVLIDEAYIDFSESGSWIEELGKLPNLVVTQTFSKAHSLAAARVGVAYASKEIIEIYNSVKPPYNVSSLNQKAAIESLSRIEETRDNIKLILENREKMAEELMNINSVRKIYPSDSNFLLVEFEDGPMIFQSLIAKKIITRNRDQLLKNCIRISIGTEEENSKLINELKAFEK